MNLSDRGLELRFDGVSLGLSARRIWEHTALRQANPFRPITPRAPIQPEKYIDVIDACRSGTTLLGVTLDRLMAWRRLGLSPERCEQLLDHVESHGAQLWIQSVEQILLEFSRQRGARNVPAPFLPQDDDSPFGVQGLNCALLNWLNEHRTEKAGADQWLRRIENLRAKGLRAEEFEVNNVDQALSRQLGETIDGGKIIEALAYKNLELSILPMLRYSGRHVRFTSVPRDAVIKRIKPKLKRKLQTRPQWRDPVMGYWIDVIDWDDLLGQQRGWMAFTVRGQPVTSGAHPHGLCESPEDAMALADGHASKIMPKMSTCGRWSDDRPTGGEQYREWLVTLPYHPQSYLSGHFEHRNILLHVRCDIRESDSGDRVLVLQEIQSDWAQNARRPPPRDSILYETVPQPPWLKEWPALALKLMLLHAARSDVTGLAWTPGNVQAERWGGLGEEGLIDLYDRTLPKELNRLLRPHKKQCETVDVYQPVNFSIEPADSGYVVKDENGGSLGTAESWPDVHKLLPDGAHEVLTTMHGVRLDDELREKILGEGFYAWGMGIG